MAISSRVKAKNRLFTLTTGDGFGFTFTTTSSISRSPYLFHVDVAFQIIPTWRARAPCGRRSNWPVHGCSSPGPGTYYINPLHHAHAAPEPARVVRLRPLPGSPTATCRPPVRASATTRGSRQGRTIDVAAKARRPPLLRVRKQRRGSGRRRPRALSGRRQRHRWPATQRQERGRHRHRCRCHREAAVVGAGGGHDERLHVGRRRRGRLQHRLPRPPRGVPRRRQGPPQQRAPPTRVPPGARRAPPRAPPAHRPPPRLLRPARRRRAGAGVRAEREPARAAPRRRHGGADAVGAAGVGGAAGVPRAGVPPPAVRAAGGARRREGVQRAAGRGHGRQAVRLRVVARGVLGGRRRPPWPWPWPAPAGAARRAGVPGLRGPALPPLRRGHQEERRVQLRRAPARAAHRRAGVPRRPAPDGVRGAEARRRGQRRGRRARGPEAGVPVRRPRGGGRGGAGGRVRWGQPEPPAVDGRRCADPGAAAARPVLGRHVHRRRRCEAVVDGDTYTHGWRSGEGGCQGGGGESDACSDIIRRGAHCGRGMRLLTSPSIGYCRIGLVRNRSRC